MRILFTKFDLHLNFLRASRTLFDSMDSSLLQYGLLCLDTIFTGVYWSLAASRFLANTQILTLSCSRAISGNADRVIWSMPFSNAHQSISFHFEICLCSSLGFTAFSSVVHTGTCPLKGAPVKNNLKEE